MVNLLHEWALFVARKKGGNGEGRFPDFFGLRITREETITQLR